MQNREIEIHDSCLDAVLVGNGDAVLHFSAVYIHQSSGIPGVDPGTGWMQEATLRIGEATVRETFSTFPAELRDGYIKLDGVTSQNLIPIPLNHTGAIELHFESSNGGALLIIGASANLALIGEPKYIEEFRP